MDLLRPDVGGNVRDQQASQKNRYDSRSASRRFEIDQTVWVRNYREGPSWVQGKVVDQVGPLSYHIQLLSDDLKRRHVDQLRARRRLRGNLTADAGSVTEDPNEEVYSPSLGPTESVAVDRDTSTLLCHHRRTLPSILRQGPDNSRHPSQLDIHPEYGTAKSSLPYRTGRIIRGEEMGCIDVFGTAIIKCMHTSFIMSSHYMNVSHVHIISSI